MLVVLKILIVLEFRYFFFIYLSNPHIARYLLNKIKNSILIFKMILLVFDSFRNIFNSVKKQPLKGRIYMQSFIDERGSINNVNEYATYYHFGKFKM